jgi:hypothetical protein
MNLNNNNNNSKEFIELINRYSFPVSFDYLSPLINDFQNIGNLLNILQKNIFSEPVMIKGTNLFSINNFFFFTYKNLNIYMNVEENIQTDYFSSIKFNIYKTQPETFNFKLGINLHYFNSDFSLLFIIVYLPKKNFNPFLINISLNEQIFTLKLLKKTIELNHKLTFHHSSILLKNNFDFINNLLLNYSIYKFIIPYATKIEKYKNKNDFSNMLENDIYRVSLNDKKGKLKYNNFFIQIKKINQHKNSCKIFYEIKKIDDINQKPSSNSITFFYKKITENVTFLNIKTIYYNFKYSNENINSFDKYINKIFQNLQNLCDSYFKKQQNKFICIN